MKHTLDDLVLAVREVVGGLTPNLNTHGFSTAIPYPPLSTPLSLEGIPLDPFIRVKMKVTPATAADIYEDYLSIYLSGKLDDFAATPRDFLIKELGLTKADGKWLFPPEKKLWDSSMIYLIRLIWAIGKASGSDMQISDRSILIEDFPEVGIAGGRILSHWFQGRLPELDSGINVFDVIHTTLKTPSLHLHGDSVIRAYHNMTQLDGPARDAARMALRILLAGYKRKLNLDIELCNPKRREPGKAVRKNLRRVASEIRGYPGNPAPRIYRELVRTSVVEHSKLLDGLPQLVTYYQRPEGDRVDPEIIRRWTKALRKLGG